MEITESAVSFDCQGAALVGILSVPQHAPRRAVLIVVGGAQYRCGSHRQFVLMARALARCGMAVLRFDFRGMGDSAGEVRQFADSGADLAAAMDHLQRAIPNIETCTLLGLCDGASAAILAANLDPRIGALVLINPWVDDADGAAAARMQHYYLRRLTQVEFWRKLLAGRWQPRQSLADLLGDLKQVLAAPHPAFTDAPVAAPSAPLRDRLYQQLVNFNGPVLLLLSTRDMTALQFKALLASSAKWRALARRDNLRLQLLDGANHTFSTAIWRAQVLDLIIEWNQKW